MILYLIWFLLRLFFYFMFAIFSLLVFIKTFVILSIKHCKCTTKIEGKTVLITGGNTGIGYETAKRLAEHGARVVIASRNLEKSRAAAQRISDVTGNLKVEAKALDLSSFSSIKSFVDDFNRTYDRLDILINNAGYSQLEQIFTKDGIEMVMLVNHFGPAYLTHLLLDKLAASKPSRIVFVSSGLYAVHRLNPDDLVGRTPRNFLIRYGNSKLCNILSAIALSKRLPEGVTANALHPGTTASEIWERIPWEFPRKMTYAFLNFVCRTVEECAQTSIHAALAPSLASVTGSFLEECEKTGLMRVPSRAETEALALRVWDDTIKIAEDSLRRANEA